MDAPSNHSGPSDGAEAGPPPSPPPLEALPEPPRKSGLAFFAILLLLFALLGSLAQAASPVLGLAWSELFALLLPAAIAAAGSDVVARRALLLARRPPANVLAVAALVGLAGFFAAGALMALTSLALPARWIQLFDVARLFERPVAQRVALGAIAATLAPFCEEVAFRGWLLSALRTKHRAGAAVVASGFLFALMHLDPVRFVALFALGVVYAWLAWRAGSIWPPVLAHAANNTLGVVLAGTHPGESSLRTAHARPLQLAFGSAVTLAIMAGVLLLVMSAYRRATPAPPGVAEIMVRERTDEATAGFELSRVPRVLLLAIAVAVASLAALLAAARHAR